MSFFFRTEKVVPYAIRSIRSIRSGDKSMIFFGRRYTIIDNVIYKKNISKKSIRLLLGYSNRRLRDTTEYTAIFFVSARIMTNRLEEDHRPHG